jgi:general secretion pathway protein D
VRPESGESPESVAAVFTEKLEATMKALNQTAGVDLLSSPRVTTLSRQRATIEMVREFRYATEWERGTKPGTWKPTAFETKNIGITLGVDATVNEEGTLALNLTPEITEVVGFKDIDAGGKIVVPRSDPSKSIHDRLSAMLIGIEPSGRRLQPIFSTRKIDASVSIMEGQTVVVELPGKDETQLVESREGKGAKKREILQVKRRLIVFVTTKVIKPVTADKTVPIKTESVTFAITSESVTFDKAKGVVTATGNVKIETPQGVIMAEKVEFKPKK